MTRTNAMQIETVLEKIDGLANLINEKFDKNAEEHAAICKKQDHTNGDVTSLKQWKSYINGAMAVITFILVAIIIPLLNNYLKNTSSSSIEQRVNNVMSQYLEKVEE